MSWLQLIAQLVFWAVACGVKAESGSLPTRGERAPFPPDEPWEILPPIDEKQAALKRKAADDEFWETM